MQVANCKFVWYTCSEASGDEHLTDFPRPFVTVDVVLLTLVDGRLRVALVERDKEPEAGRPALVGGFLRLGEDDTLDAAVRRILRDKAGLEDVHFEQLMTFGSPDRDARGWSVSVSYLAAVPVERILAVAGPRFHLADPDRIDLPFDHGNILASAIGRLRSKGSYSALPAHFLGEPFSIEDLRRTYEAVLGRHLDKASFRRKVLDQDFLDPVEERRRIASTRPSQLYRLKDAGATFSRVLSG